MYNTRRYLIRRTRARSNESPLRRKKKTKDGTETFPGGAKKNENNREKETKMQKKTRGEHRFGLR